MILKLICHKKYGVIKLKECITETSLSRLKKHTIEHDCGIITADDTMFSQWPLSLMSNESWK